MDITTDFGSVILGSSPGGCTQVKEQQRQYDAAVLLVSRLLCVRLVGKTETCFSPFPKEKKVESGREH